MKKANKDQTSDGACQVCHQSMVLSQLLPASMVRGGVLDMICGNHADWDNGRYICVRIAER